MHNPVLPAVDIIIACHRFPSEDVNGRARQDKGKEGGNGDRLEIRLRGTGTYLNKWEYISGGFPRVRSVVFICFFNTFLSAVKPPVYNLPRSIPDLVS